MEECVDGDYQKYCVEPGSYTRQHFFGKYPELLELVNHLTRRADSQAAARRPRHAQSLCGLQGRGGTQRPADGDPGKDRQRLRPRRSGRRQEHFAPAEKNEREGAARIPRALRDSHHRRRDCGNAVLSSARRQRRKQNICSNGARRSADFCPRESSSRRRSTCRSWIILPNCSKARATEISTTMAFGRLLSDFAAAQRHQQKHRADHSRRGAHVRPGRIVPRDRNLFVQRPALRAGGQQDRCFIITRRRTGRFSKKASPRPARWRRSSRRARATRRTACR